PMVQLSILGTKIYVIGSVEMMSLIQRQPRVISSRSWFAKFVCALVGCSSRSMGNFQAHLGASSTGDSMLLEGVRATKRILNSAKGTEMNYDAARIVSDRFKALRTPDGVPLDLFEWVKHEMLHLVSESAYGPNNPFWRPEIEKAFWYFEESTLAFCSTGFLPEFIRSKVIKGFQSRELLVQTLHRYLNGEDLLRGSPIVNTHFSLFKASLDDSDVARFECANALGSFANTIPTSFWMLYQVYSDQKLLTELRDQIKAITSTEVADDGALTVNRIDLRRLKSATILFSAIEEVSRLRAVGVGVRVVTEDTVVGEGVHRYLLKKGGWVLIANRALHSDKTIWGEDADQFVARRFCGKTPHLSFRGFGNGASACCGKNFAEYHIASFMAIMVMRYDISPVNGKWKDPGQDGRDTASQVAGPVESPMVHMELREDPCAVEWRFHC
ncbi:cytochrome P450, partial [Bimuria novae-zelandiae CBS 107.79]